MTACNPNWEADRFHVSQAARSLRAGGVVAHATEGVWGLACNPFDVAAVAKLLHMKARDHAKGLILIGAEASVFADELSALDDEARRAVEESWPGATSWVVPNRRFAVWITGEHPSVAIRVPGHPQARALCAAFGGPLVSTSANLAGRASTDNVLKVRRWFGRHLDYLLPGATGGRKGPSEIRNLAGTVLQ